MTQITINIKVTKINDAYGRYVGVAVDEPLVASWWVNDPTQNLGTATGSQTFSKVIDLPDGSHTVEAGISSNSAYPWDIEIIVDDKSLASGSSYSGAFVSTSFNIGVGVVTPEMRPLDRLKMIWQKIRSFIIPEESIEAH